MTFKESITEQYLSKLDALNMIMKVKAGSGYNGIRKSNLKGNSIEFSDFRNYTIGDDIKNIDWNSYARLDKLFVKLFAEEKQAYFNIIIDNSKSMDFGKVNKGYYAKMLAASLSYIILKNTDKVNIFTCNNNINIVKTNINSKNMFTEIIDYIDKIEFMGNSLLTSSLKNISNKNVRQGVSIIISDFFSDDGYKDGLKLLQYLKQDVIAVHVLSEEEINPIYKGFITLIDSENNENRNLEINESILNEYNKALKNFKLEINDFCKKRNFAYKFIPTDTPLIKAVNSII